MSKLESTTEKVEVKWYGYVALILGALFFSGIFKDAPGPLKVLDFNNVLGSFGTLGTINDGVGTLAVNFRGDGGTGPRDGWLYALTLIPSVMFALGVVRVIDHLDGMKAAQKLLSPLLKPLLGLPGFAGLTLIASLQSTDAAASMTKELKDDGYIDEKQKAVFCAFQFSGASAITNFFASGAALFPFIGDVPIFIPLALILIMKFVGANLLRLYLNKFDKGEA
ncbi:TPA: hypothetical protein UMQ49_002825 [Clostridioides difficile]|nr:hypothetical protein [Clostridioides difficile]